MAELPPPDRKLLERVLRAARRLEATWESAPAAERARLVGDLVELVAACAAGESEALRRLAPLARHLGPAMTLPHFLAIVVPFERLASRALRDDDFLVLEEDREPRLGYTPLPFKAVLDNIRSAFNVGAIFRTSECLGIEELMLTGYTATPDDDKTARTAMGTAGHVPWRHFARAEEALASLRASGFTLIALETVAGAPTVHEFPFPEKTALLLGNERFGLDPDLLKAADAVVRIPVFGRKNSLNVGIAFAITAYEYLRQRHPARAPLEEPR